MTQTTRQTGADHSESLKKNKPELVSQKAASVSIEGTLYLPWGVATGIEGPECILQRLRRQFLHPE